MGIIPTSDVSHTALQCSNNFVQANAWPACIELASFLIHHLLIALLIAFCDLKTFGAGHR